MTNSGSRALRVSERGVVKGTVRLGTIPGSPLTSSQAGKLEKPLECHGGFIKKMEEIIVLYYRVA